MNHPLWLFDLDNTLHNASAHIFPHINAAMTAYIAEHVGVDSPAADRLRVDYWHRYGATLLGLIRHHGTDPAHFLQETHRFERLHDLVVFDRALRHRLNHLRGQKIIFSNAPADYACAVLEVMGIRACFDIVFAVEQMRLAPKPSARAFRRVLRAQRIDARRCVLVEDSLENLKAAKRLGMKTVWISREHGRPAFVDVQLASVLALPRAAGKLGLGR